MIIFNCWSLFVLLNHFDVCIYSKLQQNTNVATMVYVQRNRTKFLLFVFPFYPLAIQILIKSCNLEWIAAKGLWLPTEKESKRKVATCCLWKGRRAALEISNRFSSTSQSSLSMLQTSWGLITSVELSVWKKKL